MNASADDVQRDLMRAERHRIQRARQARSPSAKTPTSSVICDAAGTPSASSVPHPRRVESRTARAGACRHVSGARGDREAEKRRHVDARDSTSPTRSR